MNKTLILAVFLALPGGAAAAEPPQGTSAEVSVPAQNPPAQKRGNRFMELYLPQVLLAAAVLIIASEAGACKFPQRASGVRRFWNWVLFVSFAVCAVLGLALLFPLDRAVKGFVWRGHIWTGVAALAAGAYHSAKRFKAMC